MENLVYSLYGLWFWLTRKYRAAVYNEVAQTLDSARTYLIADYATRASTRDRGSLLPAPSAPSASAANSSPKNSPTPQRPPDPRASAEMFRSSSRTYLNQRGL
jgi:hypothetical protein